MDLPIHDFMADEHVPPGLVGRVGRLFVRQRLGLEVDLEARAHGRGRRLLRNEKLRRALIRAALSAAGLYARAQRNAEAIAVRHNRVRSPRLPRAFDGFTILHLSDLHADLSEGAMRRLASLLPGLHYDLCVMTGDFRGLAYGPIARALEHMRRLCAALRGPTYGVLGNHDSLEMLPALEAMGIRMLMNEADEIWRGADAFHLAGVDDPHFFRLHNIEKAGATIPPDTFTVLLSHSPELYRPAAHAGFDLMLSGHTHGGQICLPGGIPLTLSARLPRRLGAGAWHWRGMDGYTSAGVGTCVLPVRLNCPPEITLHHLEWADASPGRGWIAE
jgi:uncharacterized protein